MGRSCGGVAWARRDVARNGWCFRMITGGRRGKKGSSAVQSSATAICRCRVSRMPPAARATRAGRVASASAAPPGHAEPQVGRAREQCRDRHLRLEPRERRRAQAEGAPRPKPRCRFGSRPRRRVGVGKVLRVAVPRRSPPAPSPTAGSSRPRSPGFPARSAPSTAPPGGESAPASPPPLRQRRVAAQPVERPDAQQRQHAAADHGHRRLVAAAQHQEHHPQQVRPRACLSPPPRPGRAR